MADFWWNPDDTFEDEKIPAITSGFRNRDRNRTGVPEDVQPISEVRGDSLGGTQYGYRRTDSGIEFWNTEEARVVDGREAEAALELYEKQQDLRSDINDRNEARREQPATAQRETASAPVQEPGSTVLNDNEGADRRRDEMVETGVQGVTFDQFSRAGLDTPDYAESRYGALPRRITYETAMDLTPESAKEVYQRTFNKAVPADMSPNEALREELRRMQR